MTLPPIGLYHQVEGMQQGNQAGCIHIGGKWKRRGMSELHTAIEDHHGPGFYEIRLKGHLHDRWAEWFDGLTITREDNGETLLAGPVVDQAALHGLLRRVRDLGLPLVSVMQVDPKPAKGPEVDADTDGSCGPRSEHNHSKKEANT
jgi:hypothetical protein